VVYLNDDEYKTLVDERKAKAAKNTQDQNSKQSLTGEQRHAAPRLLSPHLIDNESSDDAADPYF